MSGAAAALRNPPLLRALAAAVLAIVLALGLVLTEDEPAATTAIETLPDPVPAAEPVVAAADSAPADAGKSVAADAAPPPPPPAPPAEAAAAPAADTAAAPPVAVPAAPLPDGYRLQLGVFGVQQNAHALQAELQARGFPAQVESRVVLGPFADRNALEQARGELRHEFQMEGTVVPPRKARSQSGGRTTTSPPRETRE